MSKAASIIEINGTTYDTATGNVVGAVRKVASQVKDQSKVIDGFVRKSGSYAKSKTEIIKPSKSSGLAPGKSAKSVHGRAQRSRALMRTVVSKPKLEAAKSAVIKPSLSKAVGVEEERRARANAIVRHHRVKHFSAPKPAPQEAQPAKTIVAKARPMASRTHSAATVAAPLPSMVASVSHQRLERLLDEALVRADAHKRSRKRGRGPLARINRLPRWLTFGIILLLAVLVAGFIAWRDIPAVAMKVAGEQAHVSANLPGYTPAGFAISGQISHSAGAVTVQYKNSAGYSYALTQRNSDWDSSSLAANMLNSSSDVQTSQIQGMTVYIYGSSNNATWVNNGIWYTLKNKASLTSDQILSIVQSL